MDGTTAWTTATVLAGFGAGWAVASFSARMGDGAPPGRVRAPAIMAAAVVVAGLAALSSPGPMAVVSAVLGWWLLWLAVLDAEQFWLPDALTLPLAAAGMAFAAAFRPERALDSLIGAAAGYAALRLVAAAYHRWRGREGLGGGDAKLLAAAGAWVGWMGLPSVLVLGCAAGLAVAAARALRRGGVAWGEQAPFGTFLAVGTWLTWLYGPIGG